MKEKVISIAFNCTPAVSIRTICADDLKSVIKNKKKYPFLLDEALRVSVKTSAREFSFLIQKGYLWNGADIPKSLFFVGQSKDNNYLVASLVHDWLLEFKHFVMVHILQNEMKMPEFRRLTSLIFREILKMQDTNCIKANIMAFCVDVFQMTINRGAWKV